MFLKRFFYSVYKVHELKYLRKSLNIIVLTTFNYFTIPLLRIIMLLIYIVQIRCEREKKSSCYATVNQLPEDGQKRGSNVSY